MSFVIQIYLFMLFNLLWQYIFIWELLEPIEYPILYRSSKFYQNILFPSFVDCFHYHLMSSFPAPNLQPRSKWRNSWTAPYISFKVGEGKYLRLLLQIHALNILARGHGWMKDQVWTFKTKPNWCYKKLVRAKCVRCLWALQAECCVHY